MLNNANSGQSSAQLSQQSDTVYARRVDGEQLEQFLDRATRQVRSRKPVPGKPMELVERHGIEQASLSETGPCVLLMAKPYRASCAMADRA